MKLRAVAHKSEPGYPVRTRSMGRGRRLSASWLRRAVAAAATAFALSFGGCYGSTPRSLGEGEGEGGTGETGSGEVTALQLGERPRTMPVDLTPPDERLAGAVAPTHFQCGDDTPTYLEPIWVPGWFEGGLCGEQTAWAAFDVVAEGSSGIRINLEYGGDEATLAIIGPDGVELAELGPGQSSVDLPRQEGRWLLAADPLDPEGNGWTWISGSIEDIES